MNWREKFSCNYSNHWVSLGGTQNYGVGDYGLNNEDALKKESLKGESESLFFETTATRPGISDLFNRTKFYSSASIHITENTFFLEEKIYEWEIKTNCTKALQIWKVKLFDWKCLIFSPSIEMLTTFYLREALKKMVFLGIIPKLVDTRGGTRPPSECDYLPKYASLWRLSIDNRL